MVPLLMHLILAHRAQSRGEIRACRLYMLSMGLLLPLVRELIPTILLFIYHDNPVLCSLLKAHLFLGEKTFAITQTCSPLKDEGMVPCP